MKAVDKIFASGDLESIKRIVDTHFIPSYRTQLYDWKKAYYICVEHGHLESIKYLLNKCRLEKKDHFKALKLCAKNGHQAVLEYILPNTEYYSSLEDKCAGDEKKEEIMAICYENGHHGMVKYLIEKISCLDIYICSLTKFFSNAIELLKYFISIDVDINTDFDSDVIKNGDMKTLEYYCNIIQRDQKYYNNGLNYSAHFKNDMVKYFILRGADVNNADGTALAHATFSGNIEVMAYLIAVGADIHKNDNYALALTYIYEKKIENEFLLSLYTDSELEEAFNSTKFRIILINSLLKKKHDPERREVVILKKMGYDVVQMWENGDKIYHELF